MITKIDNQDWYEIFKTLKLGKTVSYIRENKTYFSEKLKKGEILSQEDIRGCTTLIFVNTGDDTLDEYHFDMTGLTFYRKGIFESLDLTNPETTIRMNSNDLKFVLSLNTELAKKAFKNDPTHQIYIQMDIDAFKKQAVLADLRQVANQTINRYKGQKRNKNQEENYQKAKYLYAKATHYYALLSGYRETLDKIQTQATSTESSQLV